MLTDVTELKNMYKTVSIYRWKLLKIQDVLFKQCEKVKQKILHFCLFGVCVYVCVRACVCLCVCMHARIHACLHAYMCESAQVCVCVYVPVCACVCVCMCMC